MLNEFATDMLSGIVVDLVGSINHCSCIIHEHAYNMITSHAAVTHSHAVSSCLASSVDIPVVVSHCCVCWVWDGYLCACVRACVHACVRVCEHVCVGACPCRKTPAAY